MRENLKYYREIEDSSPSGLADFAGSYVSKYPVTFTLGYFTLSSDKNLAQLGLMGAFLLHSLESANGKLREADTAFFSDFLITGELKLEMDDEQRETLTPLLLLVVNIVEVLGVSPADDNMICFLTAMLSSIAYAHNHVPEVLTTL